MRNSPMLRAAFTAFLLQLNAGLLLAQDNPAEALRAIGGTGGTPFTRSCPAGHVITGIRARTGLAIDAIGIKCRPVNADGTLGVESSVGTLAGGSGGNPGSASCPVGSVVTAQSGTYAFTAVDHFDVRCRRWDVVTRTVFPEVTSVIHVHTGQSIGSVVANAVFGTVSGLSQCSRASQPAVLLRGRSGSIIDAVGLTCDEP